MSSPSARNRSTLLRADAEAVHRLRLLDGLWTLLLVPLAMLPTIMMAVGTSDMSLRAAVVIGVGSLAPLVFRRTNADAAMCVVVAAHVVQLFAMDSMSPNNIAVPIMIYAVLLYGNPRWHRLWLVVAVVGAVAGGTRWGWYEAPELGAIGLNQKILRAIAWVLFNLIVIAASWFMGQWARQRRLNTQAQLDRIDALTRERERDRQLAAEEERTRIAREMHDIVAHSLSVIVVQSDGAGYLAGATELGDAEARLAQVRTAIETINQTARQALGDTRRLVGVLRQPGEKTALAPAATLDQIEQLVEGVRVAGIPASYEVTGDASAHPELTTGAQMALYRVVQESLTNVMKHAGAEATVQVTLAHSPHGVRLDVLNTGSGTTSSDGQGHGVVGMRERMSAWGGTLEAGPRFSGGYRVVATIPTNDRNPS